MHAPLSCGDSDLQFSLSLYLRSYLEFASTEGSGGINRLVWVLATRMRYAPKSRVLAKMNSDLLSAPLWCVSPRQLYGKYPIMHTASKYHNHRLLRIRRDRSRPRWLDPETTLKELATEDLQSYRNFIPMDRHEFHSTSYLHFIYTCMNLSSHLFSSMSLHSICFVKLCLLFRYCCWYCLLYFSFILFYFFPVLQEMILFLSTEVINKETDSLPGYRPIYTSILGFNTRM